MGQDGGDAGADGVAAIKRDLADSHAGHIGDGVERPGGHWAGRDAEVAGADGRSGVGGNQGEGEEKKAHGAS